MIRPVLNPALSGHQAVLHRSCYNVCELGEISVPKTSSSLACPRIQTFSPRRYEILGDPRISLSGWLQWKQPLGFTLQGFHPANNCSQHFLNASYTPGSLLITPGLISFNSHCSVKSKSRLTFEFLVFEVLAPIL